MRVLVTALLAAFSTLLATGPTAAQERPPIKIGLVAPLTGPLAQAGRDLHDGCRLYWQETGGRMAGRKVEMIVEDTEGRPATALAKARKLVEGDGVHVLAGTILAEEAWALAPYVDAQALPAVFPIASADDLSQRRRPRWVIRTGFSNGGNAHPLGDHAARVLGYKKVVTLAPDDALGWESVGGFHRAFEDAGGRIVQKLWVPPDATDAGPHVARITPDADAVLVAAQGPWATLLARAWAASPLRGRVPLLAAGLFTDEHVLARLGDESVGIVTAHHYAAALDTPANHRFRAAFEKAYARVPSSYAEGCYTAARLLAVAAGGVGGLVEDRGGLLAAFRRAAVPDAPRGPVKADPFGNPVQNVYIRRVQRVDGKLENTVIHTYPDVSQFWTYNPREFLRRPAYSRDLPPCTHC
jgi:branched-chain amino acid transport system substrate-binding protein